MIWIFENISFGRVSGVGFERRATQTSTGCREKVLEVDGMFGSNNEKRDGKLKAANQKMRASTGASNVFGEDEYLIYLVLNSLRIWQKV